LKAAPAVAHAVQTPAQPYEPSTQREDCRRVRRTGCDKNVAKGEKSAEGCSKPLTPAQRPAAAPSTARRSRCSRSPMSCISCMVRSHARQRLGQSPPATSGPTIYRSGFTTHERDRHRDGQRRKAPVPRTQGDRYQPRAAAIFVYSTCVTALIGDDIDAV